MKEVNDIAAENVESLLNILCERYGKKFYDWVWKDGSLSNEIIILVNGRAIEHLDSIHTKLTDKDEVAIFPKMAGG